ncbi:MAG: RagB/SusD family nutrient uptake outer membrane protein [Prevotella sp.]|nr:RagB/SusD family nutrient uptake outer membrane protein [Prevotella sp.]
MKRKIYNINKVGLMGLMGLMGLTQTGCSDFLEIKPQTEIILEDFWNEKADVENVVTGCYSALLEADVRNRMMVWGEVRSDNVMSGQNINNNVDLYNVLKENITAMNSFTKWDAFYDVINRCNTVIKYAPGVAEIDPGYTEGDLKANIAEVSALRDLCYFYLIRTFRDVPYSTEAFTDDDQVMDLPATPFATVLEYLIADLEKVKNDAVTRYPETKPRYQTGRITKDVIHAMLCEMYLWKQDYDNCIRYADLVIASKKEVDEENRKKNNRQTGSASSQAQLQARLNGYPLVNDRLSGNQFGDYYEEIFVDGASKETIFELMYEDRPEASGRINNSAISSYYGNSTNRKGLLAPSSLITDDIGSSSGRTVFEDANKKIDSRLYVNCSFDDGVITKYAVDYVSINASSADPKVSYSWFTQNNNGSKWIIYRLPDIMLLKAEALCQQMVEGNDSIALATNKPKLDAAFQLVNAINKRAICKATLADADTLKPANYTTKHLMEELVIRERQRELMFEGKRWYDLVRYAMRENSTSRIMSAASKRDDVNKQFVQSFFKKMDAIFWPYNNEEMKVNQNLIPNPAFSSGESTSMEKTTKQ